MQMAELYKKVYNEEFVKLPKWKQGAIKEDLERGVCTGLTDDFIKSVIEKSEKLFETQKSQPTTKKEIFEEVA
jgi:hypothetical protein